MDFFFRQEFVQGLDYFLAVLAGSLITSFSLHKLFRDLVALLTFESTFIIFTSRIDFPYTCNIYIYIFDYFNCIFDDDADYAH